MTMRSGMDLREPEYPFTSVPFARWASSAQGELVSASEGKHRSGLRTRFRAWGELLSQATTTGSIHSVDTKFNLRMVSADDFAKFSSSRGTPVALLGFEEIMHMTEPNYSQPERRTIPCHWVQEEGFEVLPVPVSGQDPGVLRDTAFLLKPAVPPANVRYPAA